jgi:hypothetical protein
LQGFLWDLPSLHMFSGTARHSRVILGSVQYHLDVPGREWYTCSHSSLHLIDFLFPSPTLLQKRNFLSSSPAQCSGRTFAPFWYSVNFSKCFKVIYC